MLTHPSVLLQDWQTIVKDGSYYIRANNQRKFTDEEAIVAGNYTILMQNQPLYDAKNHTFDSSHGLFRTAFKDGFPWELLEVFSGTALEFNLEVDEPTEMGTQTRRQADRQADRQASGQANRQNASGKTEWREAAL